MGPLMTTNIKRWVLGFCSTLFLAVGLVRAADKLDPMKADLAASKGELMATQTCSTQCNFADAEAIKPAPACNTMCDFAND
jgi:hypothetical protein